MLQHHHVQFRLTCTLTLEASTNKQMAHFFISVIYILVIMKLTINGVKNALS